MTHPNIKTKYIRDLFANEIYQAWRVFNGHHIDKLYTENFYSYRFGLDTAYHRIDQRIVSGELVLSSDQTHPELHSHSDAG